MDIPKEMQQTRKGWIYNKEEKKLEKDDIGYKTPNHELLYGYGAPISLNLAIKLVQDYKNDRPQDSEYPEAFTIGKQSLLSILSQENCEGVRFYLAEKDGLVNDTLTPGEKIRWKNGITLVAIGVKSIVDNTGEKKCVEIGVNESLSKEIDSGSFGMVTHEEDGFIIETIPPYNGS